MQAEWPMHTDDLLPAPADMMVGVQQMSMPAGVFTDWLSHN